jgi:dTDP-4-dehydrorhamnose 3,5-epimerase
MNPTNPYRLFTLKNQKTYPLIHDVVIRPLKVNRDNRGTLTETLKTVWPDVYHHQKAPFAQMYFSATKPGVARDVDQWHYHPGGQQDRFFVITGDIVTAIYDVRKSSPTKGTLNLFSMGESQGNQGQYLLMVPPRTHHGYVVVSKKPAILGNFPTRLYDPKEELRILFKDLPLSDGSIFSWEKVKNLIQKSIK